MREFVAILLRKLKLMYLWVTRILFAKSHMKVPFWARLYYAVVGGFIPDQCALYDLKHNSRKEYLSEFDWYRSREINGNYSFVLNDKVVCAQLLERYAKVPQTYCICMKRRGQMTDLRGLPMTAEQVYAQLEISKKLILKPIGSGKGKGIYIFDLRDDGLYVNGELTPKERLDKVLRSQKDWFLSEFIHQASYLDDLFARSANTLRMITVRAEESGKFELLFAVQRIGRDSTGPVDNASQGGLVAKVDLETGELSEARSLHNLEVYPTHPDSGSPIKGMVTPGWGKLKADILELSQQFPYLDFIAWDVLPTDDGFYILEANTSSGVNIVQLWGGQRQGVLGDVYRRFGIIK